MFLTKEDSRAFIKGSRDPLGIAPIWSALGRHIIANLTTQSNSVRGFTVLLLGRYLAERLIEERKIDDDSVVDVFLHTEQIGAYVRHLRHGVDGDIRGIDRVRARSQKSVRRIPIDVGSEGKIMSDQKVYGLWGLFSVPARISGLIEEGPIGITPVAREFIEINYWPYLEHVFGPLSDVLCHGGYLNSVKPDSVFESFSNVLSESFSDEEKQFYSEYLRDGVHVVPYPLKHQQVLVQLMLDHIGLDSPLGREEFVLLRDLVKGVDDTLHRRLDQIVRAEAIFAVAMKIFEHVLSRDGHSVGDIDRVLADRWGRSIPNIDPGANYDLLDEITAVYPDSDVAGFFEGCQRALKDGRYSDVVEILIGWNTLIQTRRGGAPWVQLGNQQRMEVRYRSFEQILPSAEEIPNLWRYSYFLSSLQNVTHQLNREAA